MHHAVGSGKNGLEAGRVTAKPQTGRRTSLATNEDSQILSAMMMRPRAPVQNVFKMCSTPKLIYGYAPRGKFQGLQFPGIAGIPAAAQQLHFPFDNSQHLAQLLAKVVLKHGH